MSALLSRNTDIIGQMDPYVQIEIRKMKYKTRVLREAGLKPQWNESFVIPIISLQEDILISCFDQDLISDDLVG
jgi:Ca2+-dependent lipid-binding protein